MLNPEDHDPPGAPLIHLLSTLIQQRVAPQRNFPLDMGLAPPWWPSGHELWRGQPPYRKPHDLKKAWKVGVLKAVIKHVATEVRRMRGLVKKSKRLQDKMTARESVIWSKVVDQGDLLSNKVENSLRISSEEEKMEGRVAVLLHVMRKGSASLVAKWRAIQRGNSTSATMPSAHRASWVLGSQITTRESITRFTVSTVICYLWKALKCKRKLTQY